jgi:hypothetical protein
MTFIELIVFGIRLLLSAGCAFGLGLSVGWSAGIPAGLVTFFAFPKISSLIIEALPKGKGNPVCPNGVCDSQSYDWIGNRESYPVCRCKCGMTFVHKGTSFEIINEDGTTTLYRIWKPTQGWVAPS